MDRSFSAAVVLVASVPCAAIGQSLYQRAEAGASAGFNPSTPSQQTHAGSSLAVVADAQDSLEGWSVSASSAARADYGYLRARASVAGSGPIGGVGVGAGATATSRFDDTFTMTSTNTALLGTAGMFTASVIIEGQMNADWSGERWTLGEGQSPGAGYSLSVTSEGVGNLFDGSINRTYGDVAFGPSPQTQIENGLDRVVVFQIPFVFGQTTSISGELVVNAGARTLGDDAFVSAFDAGLFAFNSARWQGISLVTGPGGEVLANSDWSISSASGTNYAMAIPSPGALVVFALSGLRGSRRRRS